MRTNLPEICADKDPLRQSERGRQIPIVQSVIAGEPGEKPRSRAVCELAIRADTVGFHIQLGRP